MFELRQGESSRLLEGLGTSAIAHVDTSTNPIGLQLYLLRKYLDPLNPPKSYLLRSYFEPYK